MPPTRYPGTLTVLQCAVDVFEVMCPKIQAHGGYLVVNPLDGFVDVPWLATWIEQVAGTNTSHMADSARRATREATALFRPQALTPVVSSFAIRSRERGIRGGAICINRLIISVDLVIVPCAINMAMLNEAMSLVIAVQAGILTLDGGLRIASANDNAIFAEVMEAMRTA